MFGWDYHAIRDFAFAPAMPERQARSAPRPDGGGVRAHQVPIRDALEGLRAVIRRAT